MCSPFIVGGVDYDDLGEEPAGLRRLARVIMRHTYSIDLSQVTLHLHVKQVHITSLEVLVRRNENIWSG